MVLVSTQPSPRHQMATHSFTVDLKDLLCSSNSRDHGRFRALKRYTLIAVLACIAVLERFF